MLKSTPLNKQRAFLDRAMDEALRKAFAPVLAEEMPLRLRAALDALCQIGSAYDTAKKPS